MLTYGVKEGSRKEIKAKKRRESERNLRSSSFVGILSTGFLFSESNLLPRVVHDLHMMIIKTIIIIR